MAQKTCPKCSFSCQIEAAECPACGVIFSKLSDPEAAPDAQVLAKPEIVAQWKDVVQNYTDPDLHESFLQSCMASQKLNFASQQYRKMLEVNPSDEVAKKMQEKIIQIASFQMLSAKENRQFTKPPKWTSFAILGASLILFFGFFSGSPAMLGGGFIGIILAFGVRFSKTKGAA